MDGIGSQSGRCGAAGNPEAMLLSAVTARTNFWLAFPMLFFMVCASHYVLFLAR
jgi:hypothetical protein